MPVVFNKQINEDTILIVWHITEPIDFFTTHFTDSITDETAPARDSLQWWASRACFINYFDTGIKILKNGDNKPRLLHAGVFYEVSITHSFEYAAVMISKSLKVGIDIERIDARISRVKQKFCSDTELVMANNDIEKLTLIWSAKEALYKLYSKKQVIFKENLHIDISDKGDCSGAIRMSDYDVLLPVHVMKINNYVLTWVMY